MKILNSPNLLHLALASVLIIHHSDAQAQMPGHWVPSLKITNTQAHTIGCIDSTHVLSFIDSGEYTFVYFTSDGGKDWTPWGRSDSGLVFGTGVVHGLQILSPRDIYYVDGFRCWISHDSGHTFLAAYGPTSGYYGVAAQMFTPEFGRFIADYPGPSLQVFESRDSGLSFEFRSSTPSSNICNDAFFFDSSFWLVALNYQDVIRTRDGGLTWDTVLNPSRIAFYNEIIASPDRLNVYVTGGLYDGKQNGTAVYSTSYFESTDTGNTWRGDSSIYGNRISQIISPVTGKLWALINHGRDKNGNNTAADSLFYSSNDGQSWVSDGTSFMGEALYDIVWPDSTHGYILGRNGDTAFVYRYVSDQAGVAESIINQKVMTLTCHPNPAIGVLHIESSSGPIMISDPLGRSYNLRRNGSTLDISSLPPGVYFVSDGRARAKFVKE